jgi:hypothetical protein
MFLISKEQMITEIKGLRAEAVHEHQAATSYHLDKWTMTLIEVQELYIVTCYHKAIAAQRLQYKL